MSFIGALWYKWVIDENKSTSIEDVPEFWRAEVDKRIEEAKKES